MTRIVRPSLVLAVLLGTPVFAQPIVVDDFSTNSAGHIRVSPGTDTSFDDGSGIL